ncbi:MAG: hypothetical protein ACJAS4_003312 [Bacteriovoracaceae bacterium]|jgi:hypothetical protein
MNSTQIILYLPNKPDLENYSKKKSLKNLQNGEVKKIIKLTGNHWRKIFSILSKISIGLSSIQEKTWQEYRDEVLLTKQGGEVISFSMKVIESSSSIHILSGKAHYENFNIPIEKFKAIDTEGRILRYKNIFLTPYFDYRQFPNALIETLIKHV